MGWFRKKPKPMSTHSKPSCGVYLEDCPGQFQWAKVYGGSSKDFQIRRECPVCGCRQHWNNRGKAWHGDTPNPQPGSHTKYLEELVDWGP